MHKEMEEIFEILDDSHTFDGLKERILNKFDNRDKDIERYLKGLARVFEKP